ncbi:MAG: hypothetical protein WC868_01650 [Bacteroidales bacterium]
MQNKISLQDKFVFTGIILYFTICVIVSFTQDGTVDSGDSVMHFLFSKYSFIHPSFFFHHWAKPLFVLLSSPFSQFGFTGIKIFNCVVVSLTLIFTYLTSKKITKENSFLSAVLLCFAPLYFVITFSGLTEPLFAFFLVFSLYLLISGKEISSSILISFLPFVRSEGLILLGVYAFYLIVKRKFRILPLLATGHVLYSITGYFYYHDLFWVFTEIPYAKLSSTYGSGQLLHFVGQMTYVIGIPIYLLLASGIAYMITTFFHRSFRSSEYYYKEKLLLVYGGFFAFLVAHSLFWYFGIFNSMGLKRVLICVIPFISLISLDGYNFITRILIKNILNLGRFAKAKMLRFGNTERVNSSADGFILSKYKTLSRITGFLVIACIMIFPFTGNPAAIKWKKEFSLSNDQILIKEMAKYIKKKNYSGSTYYYYPPYISLELGIDHFDSNKRKELPELFEGKEIQKNALIIWDDWCAVIENGISLEKLQKDGRFEEIKDFELSKSKFVLFVRK